jgi:hypothetical protein
MSPIAWLLLAVYAAFALMALAVLWWLLRDSEEED